MGLLLKEKSKAANNDVRVIRDLDEVEDSRRECRADMIHRNPEVRQADQSLFPSSGYRQRQQFDQRGMVLEVWSGIR